MDKKTVIYLYNGASLSDERTIDTGDNMDSQKWLLQMKVTGPKNMHNSCIFKAIRILPLKQRSCLILSYFGGLGISFLVFPILRVSSVIHSH